MIGKGGERFQHLLSEYVREEDCFEKVVTLAGVDVSYKGDIASVACVAMEEGVVTQEVTWIGQPSFPYVSSFFALREFPLIYEAVRRVPCDLLFVHGHGRAHPRKFGLACHTGLYFQRPTVGVAGRILVGEFDNSYGDWTYLHFQNEAVGALVRTQEKMNPIVVSVGHMISLKSAVDYTRLSVMAHRFPEVVHLAHLLSRKTLDSR
ncbi:MAG: endonuclease V [Theionarchaea archaeon]|nr:endonuclease V [Theionarchaea archaeon]MBU7037735.1 endonuclease V [Theionarchaea archaeon]